MKRRYARDKMTREEWLAARLPNINASEAAIVCGEAPWGSPAVLFAEKKGLRPPATDTAIFRRGRWSEAAVFEAMTDTYPEWEIQRASVYVVDEDKRQGSTPDGFARAPDRDGIGVVQAKSVSRSAFRQKYLLDPADDITTGEAELPAAYQIQTLQDMRLNDVEWGVVPLLIVSEFDWQFRMFDVWLNDALAVRIDYLIARFFREYLDPGIMPPFEPARDSELVKELYPRDDGTTIDLSLDNVANALVEDFTEVQAAIKRMRDRESEIKTELTAKLGAHTYGKLSEGRRLSWKLQHRKAHTVAASDFRVLRVVKDIVEP